MTKVNKITDLRKEVKDNLEKKSITDLTEMKLKEIKLGDGMRTITISNALNRMAIKIGKCLIDPILNSDTTTISKFREIEKITNVGDIKVFVEGIYLADSKNDELVRLLKSVAKGKADDDNFIKITIADKNEDVSTYSWLSFDAKASNEGYYHFRSNASNSYPITGLRKIVGIVYLLNAMNKYYKKNKEMADITILKYSHLNPIFKDKEQLEYLQGLMESLNIKKTMGEEVFLDNFGYTEEQMNERLFYNDWLENREFFTIETLYGTPERRYKSLNNFKNTELIAFFANFLIELNREEEDGIKARRKLSSDYATSFQTKKNIPQVVLDRMESTLFLNHFGYVEFDESVDLDKIEQIEEEWVEINKKISFPIAKDHSLRFRRLGNHNAGGLYFPSVKAVCVDLRSPKSMTHELLHMIDYTSGDDTLSSSYEFRGIIEAYRDETDKLVEKLDDKNELKKKWKGNSKYNKNYFHSSPEVFARCGEIYINQILNIESSLVNTNSNDVLYPKDEGLHSLIKSYYSKIIKEVANKPAKEDKKSYFGPIKDEIMSREAVANVLKENQLSMF